MADKAKGKNRLVRGPARKAAAALAAVATVCSFASVALISPASAVVAPVGQGFTVTPSDLAFILKQIKIAEAHAATQTPANPCGTLVGTGPNQIPDALTAYGLRTVDGSCNNLIPGNEKFATADQPFPRYTNPLFKDAEPITASFPVGPPGPTSYKQKSGSVVDSQPRMISNLIVDQSATNPAAVAAAGFPVRSQAGAKGVVPCQTPPVLDPVTGLPVACVPAGQTLFIPNVTTDIGLSPPYNSLFTFFGQFFDHGVDQTVKSGGTVFVPLKADDPLIIGPDGIAGTADDPQPGQPNFVPVNQRFMVLTRAQNQPGPDGILGTADDIQNANNTDTPWVDQSQTYSSHASHQVFLREYVNDGANKPISTGRLLGGLAAGQTYLNSPDGTTGIGTWKAVKQQAASMLGLQLVDTDVTNIPMIAADPYGKFIPGPARGLPQYVTATGLVEGDRAANGGLGVLVPANVLHFDTPFLTDIAHNADPSPQTNPATGVTTVPVPDADLTPSADFANQPPGTYDDEMLNAHFVCGDGRCNENIALSTIHQIFHSEHDRLVGAIEDTLNNDTTASGVSALAEWKLASGAPGAGTGNWNGERIFQAARFVTEMEYQHLVFEEFARKVQPAVQPFHVYHSDINPAIHAEFAHAVYRFGHSMLDDVVARTNTDPVTGAHTDNSVPLLTAFLNPPEYFNGGTAGTLTPEQAAGSVVMGSSDQTGNELDEFVNNTLRNNLLGLPLDLATLNMTRAREAGVPPLNVVRRQLYGTTGDGQLQPYTSWNDFGQNLKHPESLVNFVAAYGQDPTITGATTSAAKRSAAAAIVNPPVGTTQTLDQQNFMNSAGSWANNGTDSITGLDSVDLWVGGLAEKTNLFGGVLGSTFNYVFENQLTDLQNGDRLYYLNRTQGLNLRQQLEGNSFAELIMRNTEGTNSLKADAFATEDCKFQLANLAGTPAGYLASGPTVADDPATPCDESALLLRKPDGTIQYKETNTVNSPGINFQSVYNGTAGVDRVVGGNDNDTIYGNAGNDVMNGNGGDDTVLGGDGNDIITDLSGADVLKGGPGNDAIDGGIGNDIILGGDGQDFTSGGANDNETFAGQGNDFIRAGDGTDTVFGDGGDDWIQGGSGQDLLQGDHGAPFFDDPGQVAPGNDIFVGQVGENDYDAEGGDDIMESFPAIERNAGAGGFDWTASQYDTTPANADLTININLLGVPLPAVVNRDRFQETEALSGWDLNDHLMGDSLVPSAVGGAGFTGCDALDQAGIDRIAGLAAYIPPSALINKVANSVPGIHCPLNGPIWGEGNILLGGAGSDTIEGRGANDIIDGDAALQVRISVRTNPADPTTEIGSTDLMEHQYLHTGATLQASGALDMSNLTGPTLQEAVFNGTIDPGNLVSVREIVHPANGAAVDTAVYSGLAANYTVTTVPALTAAGTPTPLGAPGSVTTVTDNVGPDGTDTLRNIEVLQFADTATPGFPTGVTAVGGVGQATVNWVAPVLNKVPQVVTSFNVEVHDAVTGALVGAAIPVADPAATSLVVTPLNAGSYQFRVQAVNSAAATPAGPWSILSPAVTVTAAPFNTAPGAPTGVTATAGNAQATVNWTAPASNGGSAITRYDVQVLNAANVQQGALRPAPAGATSLLVTGLTNGTAVTFKVQAVNIVGSSVASAASNAVTPLATAPGAAVIGTAVASNASAGLSWTAPASDGGSPITGFSIDVITGGTVVNTVPVTPGTATSANITGLTNGTSYTFVVHAVNAVGTGAGSAASNAVTPATIAGVPTIGTATAAAAASATVRWTAPASNGGSAITGYEVQVLDAANAQVGAVRPAGPAATNLNVTGLTNGAVFTFKVQALNGVGSSGFSAASNAVTADSTAPTVTARTPAAGVVLQSQLTNVTATFSEPVTATTATFTLRAGAAAPVAAAVTTAGNTVTLNPTATLAAGTRYTATLSGVTDLAGNPLAATSWTFSTGPAPVITARTPAAGAIGVRRNTNVSFTTNRRVVGANATRVRLVRVTTGVAVAGVVTTGASVVFNPNATLLSNTQYRLVISAGLTDAAGNPLAPTSWVFTTGLLL